MKRFFWWLILLGVGPIPVHANLGETVTQVVARYGHPTGYSEAGAKTPFGTILFRAGGYELVIFLLNNQEVGARISKLNKSAFTDAEKQTIMGADTNGSAWTPVASDDPSTLEWSRADQATVMYDQSKRMLIFSTPAMVRAIHAPPPPAPAPVPGSGG
jgi:hypothetical protein